MGENIGYVVTGWYEVNPTDTTANYAVRYANGEKKVFSVNRKPYFYVPTTAHIPDGMNVEVDNKVYYGIDGIALKRLYTRAPYEVRDIRRDFAQTYEADIPFVDRVRYDLGIKGWVDEGFKPIDENKAPDFLRVLFLDIEVDDSKGFPDPQKGDAEVLSIVVYDSYTKRYGVFTTEPQISWQPNANTKIIQCKTEQEMYRRFLASFQKINPDIITGWYVRDFDITYLSSRFGFSPKQCVILDLLDCYMKVHENEIRSYSLDYVAELELGKGKQKRGTILNEYKNGTLSQYCLRDVELCVEIDSKLKLIDFILGIAAMSGCNIENSLFNSNVVDAFMFFELAGKYIQRTKPEDSKGSDDVELTGATVIQPKAGLYEWVLEVDNTAEYPNIMISWGLSPDPDGKFCEAVKKLMSLREFYKNKYKETGDKVFDDKQRVVKFIVNSFSGVMGYKKYRNYSPDIFNKITSIARKHLEFNAEFFRQKGYTVLYGDTDSVYVHIGKEVSQKDVQPLIDELNGRFNDFYVQNGGTKVCTLSTKLENIYRRILFMPVKKRYAGLTVDGKVKIRGFEVRRSNVAVATSKIQEQVLRWILEGVDVAEIKRRVKQEIVKYELIDFGIPCSLRKDSYAVRSQHFKAAEWSNTNLGKNYRSGSKFLMFFAKGMDTDVFAIDFDDVQVLEKFRTHIDLRKQIERTIKQPLEHIFEVLTPQQQTLEVFNAV